MTPETMSALQALVLDTQSINVTDAAGRERTFVGAGLKEVTDRPKREHKFLSLYSLLEFAKGDCVPGKAAVFFNPKQVVLVCDRHLMEDRCVFAIEAGKDLARWLGVFRQKGLIQHLQAWGHQLTPGSVELDSALLALHTLSLSKTVTYNNIQQDGRTVHLNYTLDGGDPKCAKLPIDWNVSLPVHEGGPHLEIPLRLEMTMPDHEKDSPAFGFTCITLDALKDESLDIIGSQMKDELPEWLILKATI